jgi:hypothetical protein
LRTWAEGAIERWLKSATITDVILNSGDSQEICSDKRGHTRKVSENRNSALVSTQVANRDRALFFVASHATFIRRLSPIFPIHHVRALVHLVYNVGADFARRDKAASRRRREYSQTGGKMAKVLSRSLPIAELSTTVAVDRRIK